MRHFNSKLAVTDEDIRALLLAAVEAPTAGNIQPWRFTVVRSREARENLAGAIRQRWATAAPVDHRGLGRPEAVCGALRLSRGVPLRDSRTPLPRPRTSFWQRSTADLRPAGSGRSTRRRFGRHSASPIRSPPSPSCRWATPRSRRASPLADLSTRSRRGCELSRSDVRRALTNSVSTSVTAIGAIWARRARRSSSASGDEDADVLFIGEAPGKNEDLKGEPFVGAAGKLLDELLTSAGLVRGRRLHRQRPQVPSSRATGIRWPRRSRPARPSYASRYASSTRS